MARHYSPKDLLRRVPYPYLIGLYLRFRNLPVQVPVQNSKPDVDALFDQLLALPRPQLAQFEQDACRIGDMASDAGLAAIIQQARLRGLVQFERDLASAVNRHSQALWTFAVHPELFDQAELFAHLDDFAPSRWTRFLVGVNLPVASTTENLRAFQKMIQDAYARQGRGRYCHVDCYLRHDPLRYCFFAYPEDHATSELCYDPEGQLTRATQKSAFEIAFVYRPDTGILELTAPGGREIVDDLAAACCVTVLGLDHLPPLAETPAFRLDLLADRHFCFRREPEDLVQGVYLTELGFSVPGRRKRDLITRANANANEPEAIYDLIEDFLQVQKLAGQRACVSYVKLRIEFVGWTKPKGKQLSFRLWLPNSSSLKDDPYEQIAKRLLVRWGIAVDGAFTGSAPLGGHPARGLLRAG